MQPLSNNQAVPDLFSAGAAEMIRTSQRLGLTWELKLATTSGFAPLMVQFDGDVAAAGGSTPATQAVSLLGPLPIGIRVWVMVIPRGINAVIGFATDGPRRRIGTVINIGDSVGFTTTETSIGELIVPVERDCYYYIYGSTRIGTSVANDRAVVRIRLGDVAGAELQSDPGVLLSNAGTAGNGAIVDVEWRATFTGWQMFTLTGERAAGTGTLRREAASNRPQLFYVDYVRNYHQEIAV